MTEIVSMETTTPVAPGAPERLGEADLAALRAAITTLEKPSLAARLAGLAGAPLEMIGRVLPEAVTDTVAQAAEGAIRVSLRTALATLPRGGTPADAAVPVPASPSLRARALDLLGRFPPGDRGHKALAALSGALGGAFGLSTLAVELPVSTTLMLRSIAEIAQREGEDLGTPEAALACMQVFALGGRTGDPKAVESGYFAVRAALAHAMADAARYAAGARPCSTRAPRRSPASPRRSPRASASSSRRRRRRRRCRSSGRWAARRSTPRSWTITRASPGPISPCAGWSGVTARRRCAPPTRPSAPRSASRRSPGRRRRSVVGAPGPQP